MTGLEAPPPSVPTPKAVPITKSVCIHPRPPRRRAPRTKRPGKARAIKSARPKPLILSQPFSYPDPTQYEKGDAFDALVAKLRLLELETTQFETSAKQSRSPKSRPASSEVSKTTTAATRRLSQQLSKNRQHLDSACLYHTSSVPVLHHSPPPSIYPPRARQKSPHKFRSMTTGSSPDLISASLSSVADMHVSVPSPPPPASIPGLFPLHNSPDVDHLRQGDTPQPSSSEPDIKTAGPSPVYHNHHHPHPLADGTHQSDPDDTHPTPQASTSTSTLCQTTALGNDKNTTGSQMDASAMNTGGGRLTITKPPVDISTARRSIQGRSSFLPCSQLRGAKPLVFTSIVQPCTPHSQRDSGYLRSHSS